MPDALDLDEAVRMARELIERHEARAALAGMESERDGIHYPVAIPLGAVEIADELEAGEKVALAVIALAEENEKQRALLLRLSGDVLRLSASAHASAAPGEPKC